MQSEEVILNGSVKVRMTELTRLWRLEALLLQHQDCEHEANECDTVNLAQNN